MNPRDVTSGRATLRQASALILERSAAALTEFLEPAAMVFAARALNPNAIDEYELPEDGHGEVNDLAGDVAGEQDAARDAPDEDGSLLEREYRKPRRGRRGGRRQRRGQEE